MWLRPFEPKQRKSCRAVVTEYPMGDDRAEVCYGRDVVKLGHPVAEHGGSPSPRFGHPKSGMAGWGFGWHAPTFRAYASDRRQLVRPSRVWHALLARSLRKPDVRLKPQVSKACGTLVHNDHSLTPRTGPVLFEHMFSSLSRASAVPTTQAVTRCDHVVGHATACWLGG